jgi:tRNA(Ile)-lysidine synthase
VVCYFNHKLRPEADQEEVRIEKLGKKLWFTVEVAEADIKKIQSLHPSKSLEELAREKRYAFLNAILNIYNAEKIITGHHLDDKIETFFFNLVRWSKLTGLVNMTEKSWAILRPLLNIEKSQILDYLESNNLEYKIDITNTDTELTRNYLRHEIIPKFQQINSNYKNNLKNILDYFEELKEGIDKDVIDFLWDNNYFVIVDFNNLSTFLQKEVIRYIYYISNWKSTIWLSEANITEIIKFINWKWNKTIKEIRNMKLKKDNKIIRF